MRHLRAAAELKDLEGLFSRIDAAYAERADAYGFTCSGCVQTCCSEHFHHHTLAEVLLLEKGLAGLEGVERMTYLTRAAAPSGDKAGSALCPLYTGGGCGLYAHRPLICRLHGIPYDYTPPGRPTRRGSGCHRFDDAVDAAGVPYLPFDRTAYFSEMAVIEIALRRRLKYGRRFRMTVAEILAAMADLFHT